MTEYAGGTCLRGRGYGGRWCAPTCGVLIKSEIPRRASLRTHWIRRLPGKLLKTNLQLSQYCRLYVAPGNQYLDVGRKSIRQPYFIARRLTFAQCFSDHRTAEADLPIRMEIFQVLSLWHSNINGGPNGGGGIQAATFKPAPSARWVPIDTGSSGDPSPRNLQSGLRRLWTRAQTADREVTASMGSG